MTPIETAYFAGIIIGVLVGICVGLIAGQCRASRRQVARFRITVAELEPEPFAPRKMPSPPPAPKKN